jgi:39S ribosomal protein L53/MRP-L53
MPLSRVAKITVQFSPLSPKGRSVREFLNRIATGKAAASNPDCEILTRVRVKGEPYCRIQFKNGLSDQFETSAMKADDIFERMKHASADMETMETMKKAGLGASGLSSEWGRGKTFAGKAQRTQPV